MPSAVIIGGGVSGLGAAKLLATTYKHRLILVDQKELNPTLAEDFRRLGCHIEAPCSRLAVLDDAALVVFSPTVTAENLWLQNAMARGIPCLSEVELGMSQHGARFIGITGTNGKSTVTAMVEHILRAQGIKAKACGNIGVSVCEAVLLPEKPETLVIELSSYQLELEESLRPAVSVFSSFSFDHLDRHKTLRNYFAAKWKLLQNTEPNGLVVMTADVAKWADKFGFCGIKAKTVVISEGDQPAGIWEDSVDTAELDHLKFMMRHDRINALMAATAASHFLQMPRALSLVALQSYKALPHRCQLIGKIAGRAVINDSKSTNVESTLVALKSAESPVVLFVGGKGKGESYKAIGTFAEKIEQVIVFGASRNEITEDLRSFALPISTFSTLKEALTAFLRAPIKGSTILFSPACASFDEFRNFEHRGEFFSETMRGLLDAQ